MHHCFWFILIPDSVRGRVVCLLQLHSENQENRTKGAAVNSIPVHAGFHSGRTWEDVVANLRTVVGPSQLILLVISLQEDDGEKQKCILKHNS